VEVFEGYCPGVLGKIVELHGLYYGKVWGPVPRFEAQVAAGLADFQLKYREGRDLLLSVWDADAFVGSIIIDGSQSEHPGARIRFFIVREESMGRGIGTSLIARALEFSRSTGHDSMYLWTVRGLDQSFALYQRRGFTIVEEHESDFYGFPQMHVRMDIKLHPSATND
jgi:GNAT superfamily N-acetyltransferase